MPRESSLTFLHPSCSSFYRMVRRSRGLSVNASVCPSETLWRTCSSLADCPPNSWTVRCTTAAQPQLVKVIEDAFEL